MSNLFQLGEFRLSSGIMSPFKIECDALTDEDWKCIAWLLNSRVKSFGRVFGIPKGGFKLAAAIRQYAEPDDPQGAILLVDDVFTSGASMRRAREELKVQAHESVIGAVVFARNPTPDWITALFELR